MSAGDRMPRLSKSSSGARKCGASLARGSLIRLLGIFLIVRLQRSQRFELGQAARHILVAHVLEASVLQSQGRLLLLRETKENLVEELSACLGARRQRRLARGKVRHLRLVLLISIAQLPLLVGLYAVEQRLPHVLGSAPGVGAGLVENLFIGGIDD